MDSDAPPLLVDPPSQRPSGTHLRSGESAKASASPHTPPGVAGSNSTTPQRVFRQDIIAVCNVKGCGREFPIQDRSDDLPYHHAPNARGALKAVCHGSGRRASVFAEA